MNRINKNTILCDNARQVCLDAKDAVFNALKTLLKPYGSEGVALYDHEGLGYCSMAELKPREFTPIERVRYREGLLDMPEMFVNGKWHELAFTDYHFLLDEVEEEITRLIEEENEVIKSEYADFYKQVWEEIGSFNELLGCAKCGHKGMHLTKDVDDYGANVIACEVRYNEHLVVEFTYGDYKRGFYPSGAWYKRVEVGFDLTDIMK
jgi:hypothetical protein